MRLSKLQCALLHRARFGRVFWACMMCVPGPFVRLAQHTSAFLKRLFWPEMQPNLVLNGAQYCVLESVGRARSAGVLQNRLSKDLGIDQRNLFHNLKNLKTRDIVRCQQVMLREGTVNIKTNLIHLARFSKNEEPIPGIYACPIHTM